MVGIVLGRRAQLALSGFAFVVASALAGAQPAPLPAVPRSLPADVRDWLDETRAQLEARSASYAAHRVDFLGRCGPGQIPADDSALLAACKSELARMTAVVSSIRDDKRLFRAHVAAFSPACTDPSVVCAADVVRDGAYLTEQVPELKNSPAADVITTGFREVIKGNWPAALAWWQTALQRDPGNEPLQRSVDLAEWMVNRAATAATAARPEDALSAAIRNAASGQTGEAIRQFELARSQNPSSAAYFNVMIASLERKQQDAAASAYWNRVIEASVRELRDTLREQGLAYLMSGRQDLAQEAFDDADFYGMSLPDN